MYKDKKITGTILKTLYRPPTKSHKGDNGRVLIIAGSEKYHGAVVLAATTAAKIVDLVYLATTKDNFKVVQKYKSELAEFIYVSPKELSASLRGSRPKVGGRRNPDGLQVDSILIGPGLETSQENKKLIKKILKNFPTIKTVLDAGALHVVKLKDLHSRSIVTPHAAEFKALFNKTATANNILSISSQHPFITFLKGPIDYLAHNGKLYYSTLGNTGLTKGGTGDVLAGLICALAAKNEAITAAKAGIYINSLAGDLLYKRKKNYFSASELIPAIVQVLANKI